MEAVFSSSSSGFRIRAAQGQAANRQLPDDSARRGFVGLAKRIAATIFFTFFPDDCRICSAPLLEVSRLPVCKSCIDAIHPLAGEYCAVCGEGLHSLSVRTEASDASPAPSEARCALCQRTDPPFERAVAYGSYDGPLRDLVHLLKFQAIRPAAGILGRMLAETIAKLEPTMPVGKIAVVPVPLHSRKHRQRGFNQAETITRVALKDVGSRNRFELCTGILARRRETGSQIGLTRHQRRENLRGAFVVTDPTRIAKRDILLIDDVFTTGTTAAECATVLLRAGAARVWVARVARTLKLYHTELFFIPENVPENDAEGERREFADDTVKTVSA